MNFALLTTTINVPEVLAEYRELGPDVPFVIAGDQKSPHAEIVDLMESIGGPYHYLTPDEQYESYPALSQTIGWNNIQRRNIAILEAAKLGADVLITVDDDNAPTGDYFAELEQAFSEPHTGRVGREGWFNIGTLALAPYTYRGWPRSVPPLAGHTLNGHPRQISIVNGLIYGDPDIGAIQRIAQGPEVRAYLPPALAGIAIDPGVTWSPINSQNTAYRAELAPLMLLPPTLGATTTSGAATSPSVS